MVCNQLFYFFNACYFYVFLDFGHKKTTISGRGGLIYGSFNFANIFQAILL
ncbi:hypothetical protein QFZ20_000143 [Flavobacterium sp. W4I14]|nr:hypothetical protein [Flavobacterium sp. W4I14]